MASLAGVRLAVVAALSVATLAKAEAPPPGQVRIRALPLLVRTVDHPSGMRIVLELDRTQPVVGVASVVDCGSAQDPTGKEGLAHLVEHLTFRAKGEGKPQRSNALEFAGAGRWNASTTHDLTTFHEIGPRESLSALLALEGDRLAQPLAGLDTEVFDAERQVVRNELLERDESGHVTAISTALSAALYPTGHPYARPVIGSEASLWSLTLEDAREFVRRCYQPQSMTLVVSGDFDPATVGRLVEGALPPHLVEMPAGGVVPTRSRIAEEAPRPPDPKSPSGVRWVKATSDRPMLFIGWSLPRGFDAASYGQEFLAAALESMVLDTTPGSDILGVRTLLHRGKSGSTLVCAVALKTGRDPDRTAEQVLGHIADLQHLSGTAFERAWARAMVSLARTTDTVQSRLVDRAQLFHLTGDVLSFRRARVALEKLERSQVEYLAYDWLSARRARVVFLKPDDWNRADREVGGTPLVFAPSDAIPTRIDPAALRTYIHRPAAEIRSVVLENHLELILVRRPTALGVVAVALRSGTVTGKPPGAARVAGLLARNPSYANPGDWGIQLGTAMQLESTVVRAQAANGNLENALELVAERVSRLRGPSDFFAWWESDLLPRLRELEQGVGERARRAFFDTVFADVVHAKFPGVADYEKLKADHVAAWVASAYRPGNAVAVVVSDLELAETERLARQAFARWTDAPGSMGAAVAASEPTGGSLRVFRVDQPGAKQTGIYVGCAAQPRDARQAVALRLLGAELRNRLRSFARGRLAGTYGFSGGAVLGQRLSHIEISGWVDDRNLNRVLALARHDLEGLADLKLSSEALDRLKWDVGIASTVEYGTSADLASLLAQVRADGLPLELVEHFPEVLESVTAEDLARMASACRPSATLGLVGSPAIVEAALKATAR